MVASAGAAFLDLNSLANRTLGGGFAGQALDQAQDVIQNPGNPENHLEDIVEISEETLQLLNDSRGAFQSINDGIARFRQADIDFAVQRLVEVQERLDIIQDLFSQARPEQRRAVLSNLHDIGREINNIASQIAQIFGGGEAGGASLEISRSQTSVQVVQGSFVQEFNGIARDGNGNEVSFSEELDVEFSFIKQTTSQETLTVNRTDEGIEIQRVKEQTQLVAVQLSVEREQTLSVNAGASGDLSELLRVGKELSGLLDTFQNTIRELQNVLNDAFEDFPEGDLITNILYDTLQSFADPGASQLSEAA